MKILAELPRQCGSFDWQPCVYCLDISNCLNGWVRVVTPASSTDGFLTPALLGKRTDFEEVFEGPSRSFFVLSTSTLGLSATALPRCHRLAKLSACLYYESLPMSDVDDGALLATDT